MEYGGTAGLNTLFQVRFANSLYYKELRNAVFVGQKKGQNPFPLALLKYTTP
jgi:hypothetical protein